MNADSEGLPAPSKDKKRCIGAYEESVNQIVNEPQRTAAASMNPSIGNDGAILPVETGNEDEAQKSASASTKLLASAHAHHASNETADREQHIPDDCSENSQKCICLNQEYHDHMNDPCADNEHLCHRRGTNRPFPTILYTMLNDMKKFGTEHIASWRPHGRAFAIYDQGAFEKTIIPKYFRQSKMSSFSRQLNAYGFVRMVNPGPDQGAYYHELFLRGRVDLCMTITRNQAKARTGNTSVC